MVCAGATLLLTTSHATAVDGSLKARWDAHVERVSETAEIQLECLPEMLTPPADAAIRGSVLFLHGFLSCNQQLRDLGREVADRGFVVLMPLMPGHGRQWPALDEDDYADLSVQRDWRRRFEAFVEEMNAVMDTAPGERVIAGLSVGAAVSLDAHLRRPGFYHRHVLFVPFLGVPGGPVATGLTTTLARTPVLKEISVAALGWRPVCHAKRRQGRAGYCDYRLKHLGAMHSLASDVLRQLAAQPLDVPLQVMAVERDPSVSQARIRRLLDIQTATGKTHAYFFPEDVPHSMLSRQDNPGVDMWWREQAFGAASRFIVDGTPVGTPASDTSDLSAPARDAARDNVPVQPPAGRRGPTPPRRSATVYALGSP
jgi:alpha-beta hydrolase superfamily lysophospholipase